MIIEEVGQPLIIAIRTLGEKTEFMWEHDRHQSFMKVKLQDAPLSLQDLENIPHFTIGDAHRDLVSTLPTAVVEFSISIPERYDLSNVTDFCNGSLMGVSIPLVPKHSVHKIARTFHQVDVHSTTEGQ